jgi:hypothetical protein
VRFADASYALEGWCYVWTDEEGAQSLEAFCLYPAMIGIVSASRMSVACFKEEMCPHVCGRLAWVARSTL